MCKICWTCEISFLLWICVISPFPNLAWSRYGISTQLDAPYWGRLCFKMLILVQSILQSEYYQSRWNAAPGIINPVSIHISHEELFIWYPWSGAWFICLLLIIKCHNYFKSAIYLKYVVIECKHHFANNFWNRWQNTTIVVYAGASQTLIY